MIGNANFPSFNHNAGNEARQGSSLRASPPF